jgi:hypothetical protein
MKTSKRKRNSPQFVGTADGKGGLIIPAEAVKYLKNSFAIDGVNYPFIIYEGKKYPVIATPRGWTIGGEVANAQHAKNVIALQQLAELSSSPVAASQGVRPERRTEKSPQQSRTVGTR